MPRFSEFQWPPHQQWEAFEDLCRDVWDRKWGDPDAKRHGRSGQAQHGVDVYGYDSGELCGVQCKKKDNLAGSSLTETELKEEVEKAKGFKPPLRRFTVATTGPRDAAMQEVARLITEEHQLHGLFRVDVASWQDILECLDEHPDLLRKHFSITSLEQSDAHDTLRDTEDRILEESRRTQQAQAVPTSANTFYQTGGLEIIFDQEHQKDIDAGRKMLDDQRPEAATKYLLDLKERIWSTASDKAKYRILTNLGVAKLHLGEPADALVFFREAVRHNPDENQAHRNVAAAHLLLGENEKASSTIDEVLDRDPRDPDAWSLKIQIFDKKVELAEVDESVRETAQVLRALGLNRWNSGDIKAARDWTEMAHAREPDDIETKGALAQILVEVVTSDRLAVATDQLSDGDRTSLESAVNLATEAWESLSERGVRRYRCQWLISRAMAWHLLGERDNARLDVEEALRTTPTSIDSLRRLGMLCQQLEMQNRIMGQLESVADRGMDLDFLLASCYDRAGRQVDAVAALTSSLEKPEIVDGLRNEVMRTLISLAISQKELEYARQIEERMRSESPTDILSLVASAEIALAEDDIGSASSFLLEADSYVTEDTAPRALVELADFLHRNGHFAEATAHYGRLANTEQNSPLTRQYLDCLYRSGDHGRAREICLRLREKHGPLRFVSEMECALLEEIGNLETALTVCRALVTAYPDHPELRQKLAAVAYRHGKMAITDEYLDSASVEGLDLTGQIILAELCVLRGRKGQALATLYQMRRSHANEADAHLKYISLFFKIDRDADDMVPEEVSANCSIRIEDQSSSKWYTIEGDIDADISRGEISPDHPLARRLLGCKTGDGVVLHEGRVGTGSTGRIVEIKSKYVHALHESMSDYQVNFPDASGLEGLQIRSDDPDSLREDIEPVLESIRQGQQRRDQLLQLYASGNATIGFVSQVSGHHQTTILGFLSHNEQIGIRVCAGLPEEMEEARSILADPEIVLVLDLTAIVSLRILKVDTWVEAAFKGRLATSQSTIDSLQAEIDQGFHDRGYGVLEPVADGKFVMHEVSAEAAQERINELQSMIDWIRSHCQVLPVTESDAMNRDEFNKLAEAMGQPSLDSMLLSSTPGRVLYVDDHGLRRLAANQHGAATAWTQAVIGECVARGVVTEEEYDKATIELLRYNYRHTYVTPRTLLAAAREDDFEAGPSFSVATKSLSADRCSIQAAGNVVADLMFELWRLPLPSTKRDELHLTVLGAASTGRSRAAFAKVVFARARVQFRLVPIAFDRIAQLLKAWAAIGLD